MTIRRRIRGVYCISPMKVFGYFLLLISPTACLAQDSVEGIKHSGTGIKNIHVNTDEDYDLNEFRQDISQKEEITYILTLDVFGYYHLDTYGSDLKKETFSQTGEDKGKLSELKQLRSSLIGSDYYIDYEIADYQKSKFKYNLATKTFPFSNAAFGNRTIADGKLIFSTIQIDKPQGFILRNALVEVNNVVAFRQSISFLIIDEKTALEIEENAASLKLLFVFRFTDAKPFKSNLYAGLNFTDYYLMTRLLKVVAYDSATGKVYREFKYVPPTPKK